VIRTVEGTVTETAESVVTRTVEGMVTETVVSTESGIKLIEIRCLR